ncbi:hypothetical protein PybrP1_003952, partial [[Pythium] brassicae (nom. inval.)]
QLVVNVIEARDLLAEDLNGFSDPFVAVEVLDARGEVIIPAGIAKTKVVKKTLAPRWDETFTIGSASFDLRLGTTLRFMLYDFDGLKRDDILGVVDIPLDLINSEPLPLDTWYKVMKVPGLMTKDARGELHVAFSVPEVSAFAPRGVGGGKKARAAAAAHCEPGKPNLLYVTIDSGKDLLAMDRNNSSDPFVKLSMVGQRHQTSTVAKTLKPHWDEKFAFLVTDPHATLELLVEDEDHTINDFLGRAQLVLADVLEFNVEKRVAVKLLDKRLREDKDRGTLQLRLSWIYDENAEAITSTSLRKKKTQSILQQLKQSMRVASGGDADADDADDDDADDEELIDDESDDESAGDGSFAAAAVRPPLPPGASWLQFLVATIHRAEELPPLDSLLFDKGETRKHSGGGIDAYVGGALVAAEEDWVRTRVHTRHGRRDQLSPVFHESLMLLLPPAPALGEGGGGLPAPVDASFSVNDWDPIGGDEVVGHFVLPDAVALAKTRGSQPFWVNLYGAPVRGCSNNSAAAVRMNQQPAVASTYRGRVLLTLKLRAKSSDAYEAKHQKRMARKLPRDLYPKTVVYRMRAHFVSATGLAQASRTYSVVVSCGLREIASSRKKAASGAVEWNETEESDKMLYPEDASQIPDVFVYLCTGHGEARRTICYQRFAAKALIEQAFEGPAAWVPLVADSAIGQVDSREGFAGTVLLRLGFGTAEASNTHVWDQKAMIEHVNRRMPYQVRVRLHGARALASPDTSDSAKPLAARVAVQCWEEQKQVQTAPKEPTSSPQWNETLCFDVHLPHLPYAPPVLVHVFDQDNARNYIGTASLSLSPDGTPAVAVSSAKQLKQNERKQLPVAHWTPVLFNGDDDDDAGATTRGHVLASVELIHKTFPDETLPDPESLTTPADVAAEL